MPFRGQRLEFAASRPCPLPITQTAAPGDGTLFLNFGEAGAFVTAVTDNGGGLETRKVVSLREVSYK